MTFLAKKFGSVPYHTAAARTGILSRGQARTAPPRGNPEAGRSLVSFSWGPLPDPGRKEMIRSKAFWFAAVLCGGHAWILAAASAPAPAAPASTEKAVFSMYCYWTGEATVGKVPGVVRTRIGDFGGNEVVEVTYDPARTDVEPARPGAQAAGVVLCPDRAGPRRRGEGPDCRPPTSRSAPASRTSSSPSTRCASPTPSSTTSTSPRRRRSRSTPGATSAARSPPCSPPSRSAWPRS